MPVCKSTCVAVKKSCGEANSAFIDCDMEYEEQDLGGRTPPTYYTGGTYDENNTYVNTLEGSASGRTFAGRNRTGRTDGGVRAGERQVHRRGGRRERDIRARARARQSSRTPLASRIIGRMSRSRIVVGQSVRLRVRAPASSGPPLKRYIAFEHTKYDHRTTGQPRGHVDRTMGDVRAHSTPRGTSARRRSFHGATKASLERRIVDSYRARASLSRARDTHRLDRSSARRLRSRRRRAVTTRARETTDSVDRGRRKGSSRRRRAREHGVPVRERRRAGARRARAGREEARRRRREREHEREAGGERTGDADE